MSTSMSKTPPLSLSDHELAFHVSEAIVPALRELYRTFDGDITLALVLGEIGQYGAASRYLDGRSPNHQPRCCNALSIAHASGIPRETVRRKLKKLLDLGWITECQQGGYTLTPEAGPSLATRFADYHLNVLAAMRSTVVQIDASPEKTARRQKK